VCDEGLPHTVQFRRRYPGASVVVFEDTDQEISDWIEHQTVEVDVVTRPRSDLETVPLAEDEMLAVSPSRPRISFARARCQPATPDNAGSGNDMMAETAREISVSRTRHPAGLSRHDH
jgi:DNA-binding transcriptional LysR family regulator